MDGETIIYIVIGLVYFIVSIFTSNKKKKKRLAEQQRAQQAKSQRQQKQQTPVEHSQPPQSQTQGQSPPSKPGEVNLEEILGELFGGETSTSNEVEVERSRLEQQRQLTEAQEAERKIREQQQELKKRAELIQKRASVRRTARSSTKGSARSKVREHGKLYKNVSIKDAIITSIILDRPYK